ncbi:MAG: hypothetical protein OHK0046_37210 [Anaerolineae bacterium]
MRDVIDVKRIVYRDLQTYFNVLIDDNNRKSLCRLWFNGGQKYIGILDGNKAEQRFPIESIDDIYQYATTLRERATQFAQSS